jgi:putative restriction endonuclease
MKFWVGVTDNRWYGNLAAEAALEEVNFWHPRGKPPFTTLPEGTPFLFKLKAPHHHIAGGGYFIKYESLPLDLAWDAFERKNGAHSFAEFEQLISRARGRNADNGRDIGCSILGEPFFFPRSDWISIGDDFSSNIVSGKSFDTTMADGLRLWDAVQRNLLARPLPMLGVHEPQSMYGTPTLVRPRRGQGTFRALVTNAYGRRCAITGESTLPVLEAAHIRPVAASGSHDIPNGLLLRSDFHKLFDTGLITVTPNLRVVVSERIKEQWFNGKAYNLLHGETLRSLPSSPADRPSAELLQWHNENRFEKGGHFA